MCSTPRDKRTHMNTPLSRAGAALSALSLTIKSHLSLFIPREFHGSLPKTAQIFAKMNWGAGTMFLYCSINTSISFISIPSPICRPYTGEVTEGIGVSWFTSDLVDNCLKGN